MVVINYSSYAHVIEKGMNKRNMTGMQKCCLLSCASIRILCIGE